MFAVVVIGLRIDSCTEGRSVASVVSTVVNNSYTKNLQRTQCKQRTNWMYKKPKGKLKFGPTNWGLDVARGLGLIRSFRDEPASPRMQLLGTLCIVHSLPLLPPQCREISYSAYRLHFLNASREYSSPETTTSTMYVYPRFPIFRYRVLRVHNANTGHP
jgi:hypothetical protein